MIVAIVGTHQIESSEENYLKVERIMHYWFPDFDKITGIVSGGAPGIDTMAEMFAERNGIEMKVFPAEWNLYGRAAGPMRNTSIVDYCDMLVAFPDEASVGTRDSIKKAIKEKKIKSQLMWEDINMIIEKIDGGI